MSPDVGQARESHRGRRAWTTSDLDTIQTMLRDAQCTVSSAMIQALARALGRSPSGVHNKANKIRRLHCVRHQGAWVVMVPWTIGAPSASPAALASLPSASTSALDSSSGHRVSAESTMVAPGKQRASH
jgi:hypothetical protein